MAIDLLDGTVLARESSVVGSSPVPAEPHQHIRLDLAVGVVRTAVMVVLAALAILVLLPAALAAQAALPI
jgi:hypothetical protein